MTNSPIDNNEGYVEPFENVQPEAAPKPDGEQKVEQSVTEPDGGQCSEQNPEKKRRLTYLYNRRWKKAMLIVIAVLLALVIALAGTFAVLYYRGKSQLLSNSNVSMTVPDSSDITVDIEDDGTVIYKGERYVFNESVTSVLVMGIDKKKESDYVSGFKGQADAIFLVVIDTDTGKTTVVAIPRDTMAEVEVSSVGGAYSGIEIHQICTAYAYGDGDKKSCDKMVKAVSRLMYGIPINTYFCMDWTAIKVLNDMVGGVTVPEYDSNWNPTGGTVTLHGQAALDYIQKRNKQGLDASSNRLDRQVNYLKAFADKSIKKMKKDITVPVKLYNTLNKHSVNTVDVSKITYLATLFMDGGADLSFITLKGELKAGKFAEIYLDEQQLYDTVINLFYEKKQ